MNVKISVFVICVEVMTYLLLFSLHDCTFTNITILHHETTLSELIFGTSQFINIFCGLYFVDTKYKNP